MIDATKYPGPALFQGIGMIVVSLVVIFLCVREMWKLRKEEKAAEKRWGEAMKNLKERMAIRGVPTE